MFEGYYESKIGIIKIQADEDNLHSVDFLFEKHSQFGENRNLIIDNCIDQLNEYFLGKRKEFSLPISYNGTEFQKKVWQELMKIPFGKTVTYNFIADKFEMKNGARAVGMANGKNKIAIIVPCHRVIGSNNNLIGYAGGLWRKEWLLKHETYNSPQLFHQLEFNF